MPATMSPEDRIRDHLEFLYGAEVAQHTWSQLAQRLAAFREQYPALGQAELPPEERLTERDAILITYGDQFRSSPRPPLEMLHQFMTSKLKGVVSGVHLLPFFPYSSDDGFSVIDYLQVDPDLGAWEHIAALGQDFRLMFDAVINHISQHSAWFQEFRRGQRPFTDYFITMDPDSDLERILRRVVRPRALPLLTAVETEEGVRHVWTTFSEDQIDLDYANPEVLLEIIDVLLYYVAHGAEIIRLDAIAYLWKEPGTSCIHLPQTHAVVKLWRAVLDAVAPGVLLITETNVPHAENISYFGEAIPETGSTSEAQLVYNFSLAPLTLHALQTGDASRLSQWAASLETPSAAASFFNFIASHDGIGVRPAEGILTDSELQGLVDRTLEHGGQVSYKTNPDGSRSVYELNITLYDFLNDPGQPDPDLDVRRFMASQAILLSLAGTPGIYVHSFFGSRNCYDCLESTGRARSINREKFNLKQLEAVLANTSSHQHQVFNRTIRLLHVRRGQSAFHPAGAQRVLNLHPAVLVLERTSFAQDETVLSVVNVSDQEQEVPLWHGIQDRTSRWKELVSEHRYRFTREQPSVMLAPYQVLWLKAE